MTLHTAEVVAIGDELIHGAMLDTNSRWLASELESAGLSLQRITVVGDDLAQLSDAILQACRRASVVVSTGGLGPTLDDRTREAGAQIAGGPCWFDEVSWLRIQDYLRGRKRPVPESNRRQAEFPTGAVVLANPVGTAPGFLLSAHRAHWFALPGVPREMQRMVQDHVLPWVRTLPSLQPSVQQLLRVIGPSEAMLGERIAAFMHGGRNPAVGVTVGNGMITIRITGTAKTVALAQQACEATAKELRPLLATWLLYEGAEELHALVVQRLIAQQVTLALAESCTGGLLAGRFTEVAGVSEVFLGGFVCYANAAKVRDLAVEPALLAMHGAVSEPVAAAMATGAAQRTGARLAIAITGVAGPGGGTPDKPVGTVSFGLSLDGVVQTWTLRMPDLGRSFIRERSVLEALAAILRSVQA
ncbi:MAG: competence/damage-inducible protein A [Planctomycetes bacterium]|jgi:nicotinamide-nucleotide amidase|nr:competence/damage-inducible protein A [Planctomycetota bacterium]